MSKSLFLGSMPPGIASGDLATGFKALLHIGPSLIVIVFAFLSLIIASLNQEKSNDDKKDEFSRRLDLHWLFALAGLFAAVIWQLYLVRFGSGSTRLLGGVLVVDDTSRAALFMLLLVGFFAAIVGSARLRLKRAYITLNDPHVPGLLLLSLSGMHLAVLTSDLLALVLCLETAGLPLVWLIGESSGKGRGSMRAYLNALFSAALLLFGALFVQRVFGTTDYVILASNMEHHTENPMQAIGVVFLCAGFSWKLAAMPFGLGWAGMSERAPSPVAILWDGCMKITLAVAGMRLFVIVYNHPAVALGPGGWASLLATVAALTFIIGGTAVLWQHRMAGLVGQLSLSVAGWIVLGLVGFGLNSGGNRSSTMGINYLVLAHGIGLVGILALCSWIEEDEEPHPGDSLGLSPSWKHLGINHPFLAVAVCVLAANLLGFPLTMGFWSRVALLESILSSEMSLSLVMIAVAAWVVSSLVLIRLIKAMWFPRRRDGMSLLTPDKPSMDRLWNGLGEDDSSLFAGLTSDDNDADKIDTTSFGARLLKIVVFAAVGLVVVGGLWPEPFLRFFSRNP